MKELNVMLPSRFAYFDSSFVKNGEMKIVKLELCANCNKQNGRGFKFGEKADSLEFICLECIPNFFRTFGIEMEDKMEICLHDASIIRRYHDLRKRLSENKITEANFLEHRDEYAKYIFPSIMKSIDYLEALDKQYPIQSALGPKWHGWWLGAGGDEVNLFFNWLRVSLERPYFKTVIDSYRVKNKEGRVPPGVNECNKIVEEFARLIKVEKKFKR